MNRNKKIWLIKEGEFESCWWCDCPTPSEDIDIDDTTEYLRIDIHNEETSAMQDEIAELKKALSIAFDMIPNPPETQGQEHLIKLIVKLLDN